MARLILPEAAEVARVAISTRGVESIALLDSMGGSSRMCLAPPWEPSAGPRSGLILVYSLTRPCLRPSSMSCMERNEGYGLRQGLVRKIRGAPGARQGLLPAPK